MRDTVASSGRVGSVEPLDAELLDADAVGIEELLVELRREPVLERGDLDAAGIRVHEARELEARHGGLERRAEEGADLARRFVRLVAHGAQILAHMVGIRLHAPGDIGLDQNAQAVLGAHVLKPARGRLEAKVDGQDGLEGRRQLPSQPRLDQHAHRIAEAADDERIARRHQHRRGGKKRRHADEAGDREARGRGEGPRSRGALLVMVVVMMPSPVEMVMMRHLFGSLSPMSSSGTGGASVRKLRMSMMVSPPDPAMRWSRSVIGAEAKSRVIAER